MSKSADYKAYKRRKISEGATPQTFEAWLKMADVRARRGSKPVAVQTPVVEQAQVPADVQGRIDALMARFAELQSEIAALSMPEPEVQAPAPKRERKVRPVVEQAAQAVKTGKREIKRADKRATLMRAQSGTVAIAIDRSCVAEALSTMGRVKVLGTVDYDSKRGERTKLILPAVQGANAASKLEQAGYALNGRF